MAQFQSCNGRSEACVASRMEVEIKNSRLLENRSAKTLQENCRTGCGTGPIIAFLYRDRRRGRDGLPAAGFEFRRVNQLLGSSYWGRIQLNLFSRPSNLA